MQLTYVQLMVCTSLRKSYVLDAYQHIKNDENVTKTTVLNYKRYNECLLIPKSMEP